MKLSKLFNVLILILVAMVIAACGGGGGGSTDSQSSGGGTPEDAAKAFFTAVFTGEGDAASFVCAGAPAELTASFDQMKDALAQGGAEIDVSGITYTKASESGDTAQVTVGGKLKVTVAGQSVEQDFPAMPVPLKKESGTWKVCG